MADDILVNLKLVPDVQNAQQSVKRELDTLDTRMSAINKKQIDGVNQATRARLDGIRREGDALVQLEQRKRQMSAETARQAIQLDKQYQLQTGHNRLVPNVSLSPSGLLSGGAYGAAQGAAQGALASRIPKPDASNISKQTGQVFKGLVDYSAAAYKKAKNKHDLASMQLRMYDSDYAQIRQAPRAERPSLRAKFNEDYDGLPRRFWADQAKRTEQVLGRAIDTLTITHLPQSIEKHINTRFANSTTVIPRMKPGQLGQLGKFGALGALGTIGHQSIPFIEEQTGFDISNYVTGGVGGAAIGGNIGGPVGAAIGGVVGVLVAALNDLTKAVLQRTNEEDYYAAKEKSEQKLQDDQNDRRHLLMYEFAGLEESTAVFRMKDPKKLLGAKKGRTDLENLSDEDLDILYEGISIDSDKKLYRLIQMEKKAREGMSEGELQTYNSTAEAEAERYARNERIQAYRKSTTPFDVEGSAQKYGYQGISNNIGWVPELIQKIEQGLDKLEDDDALTGALEDIAGFRAYFNKSLKAPDQIEKQRAKLFGGASDDSLVQIGAAEAVTGGSMAQAIQDSNMSILKETAKTNQILQEQYKTALEQYNLLKKQERTQILG